MAGESSRWRPWEEVEAVGSVESGESSQRNVVSIPQPGHVTLSDSRAGNEDPSAYMSSTEGVPLSSTVSNGEQRRNEADRYTVVPRGGCYMTRPAQAMIKNTYMALKEEKEQGALKHGIKAAFKRTATYLNVCENTVRKYVNNDGLVDTPVKKRKQGKRRFLRIDNFTLDLVRRVVYDLYDKNRIPSLPQIHMEMMNRTAGTDYVFPYKVGTLRDIMLELGFKYKVLKNKRRILVETHKFKEWRLRYLDTIEEARKNNRPIVYLDETWFNVNDVKEMGWSDNSISTTSRQPLGKGERIIITGAMKEDGWLPNSLEVRRTKTTGQFDYHKYMDAHNFELWLEKKLMVNLPPNAVVVYDNASYHSRIENKVPKKSWRNADIEDWLEANTAYKKGDVKLKKNMLKRVEESGIQQTYAVDEMLKRKGFLPVRLPPYHCHFNPIEHLWSVLKKGAREKNIDWRGAAAKELLETVAKNIDTSAFCNSYRHVEKVENSEKVRDVRTENAEDTHNGRIIISIEGDDSDDDDFEINIHNPELTL